MSASVRAARAAALGRRVRAAPGSAPNEGTGSGVTVLILSNPCDGSAGRRAGRALPRRDGHAIIESDAAPPPSVCMDGLDLVTRPSDVTVIRLGGSWTGRDEGGRVPRGDAVVHRRAPAPGPGRCRDRVAVVIPDITRPMPSERSCSAVHGARPRARRTDHDHQRHGLAPANTPAELERMVGAGGRLHGLHRQSRRAGAGGLAPGGRLAGTRRPASSTSARRGGRRSDRGGVSSSRHSMRILGGYKGIFRLVVHRLDHALRLRGGLSPT